MANVCVRTQPVQRLLDLLFRLAVHAAGCLVEDEDARVVQDRAGDADALALAALRACPRSPTMVS
jgi:hypothetical protein